MRYFGVFRTNVGRASKYAKLRALKTPNNLTVRSHADCANLTDETSAKSAQSAWEEKTHADSADFADLCYTISVSVFTYCHKKLSKRGGLLSFVNLLWMVANGLAASFYNSPMGY